MQNKDQLSQSVPDHPRPSAKKIQAGLAGGTLYIFNTLASTNRWALDNENLLSHGDVVWAKLQTAGRGRFDRQWHTPGKRGLTFSLALDAVKLPFDITLLGQVAALALVGVMEQYGLEAKVKWPNDILIRGDKIAGLLLESTGSHRRIILGIGVNANLTTADFSKMELRRPATSLAILRGKPVKLSPLLHHLLIGLEATFAAITSPDAFIALWKRHDAFTPGERLVIDAPERSREGTYAGIDTSGRLLLKGNDGLAHFFWTGDVERVSRH